MGLPLDQFKVIVRDTVLVALDLIITNEKGDVLLGRRQNAPARGYWFVPGGRIFKGETLAAALRRVSRAEIGVELENDGVKLLGVYEHLYPDNFFGESGLETHYVVIACAATLSRGVRVLGDTQHEQLQFMAVEAVLSRADIHRFTKNYFRKDSDSTFLLADSIPKRK